MTRKQMTARSDFVRQRRQGESNRRLTQTVQRAHKPMAKPSRSVMQSSVSRSRPRRQNYDIAFALGTAEFRAPGISIPRFGTRTVSGILVLLLGFLIIMFWTSATFTVHGAEVIGNQRLGVTEINAALLNIGQPVFTAKPDFIEQSLYMFYPDLESVDVRVALPNRVIVTVRERAPLIAWQQDDTLKWIDVNGVAFQPRGQVDGLIPILATGTPPVLPSDAEQPEITPHFLEPEMIQVIITLLPYLPSGSNLTYDPVYGLGWKDGRGWLVYFGENTTDIPMKLVMYQSIIEHLTRTGIRPTLVSMEYMDAPYYK